MHCKLAILILLLALGTGLTNNAFAHKSEVVGDYLIDFSWKNDPAIVGVDNSIILLITTASLQDKSNSEQITNSVDMSMSNEKMSHDANSSMNHGATSHNMAADSNVQKDLPQKGITGLASDLDVTITLNEKKVRLEMIEDLQNPGVYYSEFTPQRAGHPIIHVFTTINDSTLEVTFHPNEIKDGASMSVSSLDGTVNVNIVTTVPLKDQEMSVKLSFTDSQGNSIEHVNYDLIATQNQKIILDQRGLHSHSGIDKQSTSVLESEDPVDVQIKLLGIGKPEEKANWSGPVEELAPIHVTPEFGPIVLAMLAIGVFTTMGLNLRSKF